MMVVALVAMTATLFSTTTYGSRRFLFGRSIQPSEFAKLAVVVWAAMLVDRKGEEGLRRLSKGILPFVAVVGALDVLAVLEPDYSVALQFTVLLAVVLYAGGARIGHFVFLSFASVPVMWPYRRARTPRACHCVPSVAATRPTAVPGSQSLVAAGSGIVRRRIWRRASRWGTCCFRTPLVGSVMRKSGLCGARGVTALFGLRVAGVRIAAGRNAFAARAIGSR